MAGTAGWDPELYEARHGFVWQYGEDLMEMLAPKAGERILDLGCGTGQLTQKVAESGATVVGLDSSPAMIGQARQNFPGLKFVLQNAAAMEFEDEFDAVFSNAALHWMLDVEGVVRAMARALRRHGRLVAEFGGKGNIAQIVMAIEATVSRYYGDAIPASRTFYPSVGEYASLLESYGFEIAVAKLFDRPTRLQGEQGMADWIRQFKWYYFEGLPAAQQALALQDTVEELRPVLYKDGEWFADYRRLRLAARKL